MNVPVVRNTDLETSPDRAGAFLDFCRHLSDKRQQFGLVDALNLDVPHATSQQQRKAFHLVWEWTRLSAHDFANEVSSFFSLPRLGLTDLLAASPAIDRFSSRFLREVRIFAFVTEDEPFIALADPTDAAVIRAAELVFGRRPHIAISSFDDIAAALNARIREDDVTEQASEQRSSSEKDDVESLRDLASGAPVVRGVNDIIERAIELHATDIHVEPFQSGLTVRLRIDGLLRTTPAPRNALPHAILSRIKILAGLNIAERRLPQDGAARLKLGQLDVDIRVATMPTQHGESAVIRLLRKDRGLLDIATLGMSGQDRARIDRLLKLPHGVIVITGPTGSGKTTTLATMLSILNDTSRKILTIEDPVEYEIPGINQSQVKPAIGLTFAAALRAFVRQDPDVIMVGEVRDEETASISIHAGLTGHLVLTTLHTENAATAVPRLLDLGVEGFLLGSTLRGIIAQRLVRILCSDCKGSTVLTEQHLTADPRYLALGLSVGETIYEGSGCERCGYTGYRGRYGIFEIMEVSPELRDLINAGRSADVIEAAALKSGMTSMLDDVLMKCRSGVTSPAEALRVVELR